MTARPRSRWASREREGYIETDRQTDRQRHREKQTDRKTDGNTQREFMYKRGSNINHRLFGIIITVIIGNLDSRVKLRLSKQALFDTGACIGKALVNRG